MKKILCVTIIISLLCAFASCKKNNKNDQIQEISYGQEITLEKSAISESLKFFKLSVTPVYKYIYDTDVINNIYNLIQTYPKEPISTHIDTNGWIYYLEFSNGIKISYCGNIVSINSEQYKVDDSFEKELSILYEACEIEENMYLNN